MEWRGTEWIIPVYEVVMLVLPVCGFIALRRRVKRNVFTKARAFWYYTGFIISPVALYALIFLGLVCLEEVTRMSLVTEELARSFLILMGLGLVIWVVFSIIFGITLTFIRGSSSSPDPRVERTP